MAVGLEALEYLLPVVKDRCRRVDFDGAVRLDSRAMPATLFGPADINHVVGEIVSKSGIGKNCVAFSLRYGLQVEVSMEFQTGHGLTLPIVSFRINSYSLAEMALPISVVDRGAPSRAAISASAAV